MGVLYISNMKILIIILFVFSTFSYSQEYAELIVDDINRKPKMFIGYFEYTTDIPPIQGENCSKKVPMCDYFMTVPEFIKQMETKGWTLINSSTGNGGSYQKHFQYVFRKD